MDESAHSDTSVSTQPNLPTTRAEALALGFRHYWTGAPCKRHHIEPRFTSDATCMACRRLATAAWRNDNGESISARNSARYIKHKDRYSTNIRKWNAENPDKRKVHRTNRDARIRGADGNHTVEDLARIMKMQRGRCAYCRTLLRHGMHVDHIIPIRRGGSNAPSNIQILCPPCNCSKSAKDPIIFARQRGLLL